MAKYSLGPQTIVVRRETSRFLEAPYSLGLGLPRTRQGFNKNKTRIYGHALSQSNIKTASSSASHMPYNRQHTNVKYKKAFYGLEKFFIIHHEPMRMFLLLVFEVSRIIPF